MNIQPMKRVLLGFGLSVVATGPVVGQARLQPVRPDQRDSLTRAVFAEDRLWLLSDAGELSTIVPEQDTRTEVLLPEPALDLCLLESRVVVVTCPRVGPENWSLRLWQDGMWTTQATVPIGGDELVGMCVTDERVTLVTNRRLVESIGSELKAIDLVEPLKAFGVASILGTSDSIFVGSNGGEFGGGLRRIDRRDGRVTLIDARETGGLCAGPLNTDCDPVTAIAIEPWNAQCIVVGIGLIHFGSKGRLVEVCGDAVRPLYARLAGEPDTGGSHDENLGETVPFFGLVRRGALLYAVSPGELYCIGGSDDVQRSPLPAFKAIDGVEVSFDLPNLVLVNTSVNRRQSLSGLVPLLVPR